jgi:hypothetical protein
MGWSGRAPAPSSKRCCAGHQRQGARHGTSRRLQRLGHDARLMPERYVCPYSKGQRNDSRDAEACRSGATSDDEVRGDQDRRSAGPSGDAPRAGAAGQPAHLTTCRIGAVLAANQTWFLTFIGCTLRTAQRRHLDISPQLDPSRVNCTQQHQQFSVTQLEIVEISSGAAGECSLPAYLSSVDMVRIS